MTQIKRTNKVLMILGLFVCLFGLSSHTQEEGMFPLNLVNYSQLKEAGLKLNEDDIFKPGKTTLSDALVKLGGCTGSFVSKDGLIITNHHCVYGGVARLSTTDQNYLENGFVASDRSKELPLGSPCRITVGYEDVSIKILDGLSENLNAQEKSEILRKNTEKLLASERAKTPELEVQISTMFVGRSYMLFRYILLEDVRLVVAPPKTVGQFGGETDNWEWPRHGGDFSIVRAYVGKDGKPAKYSKDNVPYQPKQHLKIDATGADENDFIFILGYPGRTYRNRTARYLEFQEAKQLPIIQDWYRWRINKIKDVYEKDEAKLLGYAGTLQGLENTEKNYRGKMQGLRRTQLVKQRLDEGNAMMASIPESKAVISKIKTLWNSQTSMANNRFNYLFLLNHAKAFSAAAQISEMSLLANTTEDESQKEKLQDEIAKILKEYQLGDAEMDRIIVLELMKRLGEDNPKIKAWLKANESKISEDKFFNPEKVNALKVSRITKTQSTLMDFHHLFHKDLMKSVQTFNSNAKEIDALLPTYAKYREQYKKSGFIPDANSTLRLTYGYIKRYSPNDGETHLPFSTLDGVFAKANTKPDYRLPKVVADNLRVANPPAYFLDKKSKKVAVNLLYNLDTTGGNSGSPILNARGEIIGVNFDRSFTATINDYAWNESYSRSLGVDIRYCIYVMKYVSKAEHIINELGVRI